MGTRMMWALQAPDLASARAVTAAAKESRRLANQRITSTCWMVAGMAAGGGTGVLPWLALCGPYTTVSRAMRAMGKETGWETGRIVSFCYDGSADEDPGERAALDPVTAVLAALRV